MSQKIVTLCDIHQNRDDVETTGETYDLALRAPGGSFRFLTIDLCPVCAKAPLDLVAEVAEWGREFDGPTPLPSPPRRGRPPKESDTSVVCPICQNTYQHKASMRSHVRNVHGMSLAEAEGETPTFLTCPDCGDKFTGNQGLASHRRSQHRDAGRADG